MNENGIYLAYFTAEFGQSVGVFLIGDGNIAGGDLGSGVYDGSYEVINEVAKGKIDFKTAEAGQTITGMSSDLPIQYSTEIELTLPLEAKEYHTIQTLGGPINVKFIKIKELQ